MQSKKSKIRQDLISSLEDQKEKKIKAVQKRFASVVLAHFAENLSSDDGIIKNVAKNYAFVTGLDIIQQQFDKKYMNPLATWLGKSLLKVIAANTNYFGFASTTVKERVTAKMLARSGVNSNGIPRRKGFVSSFADTSKPISRIKDNALRGIVGRQPLKEFQREIKRFIIPDEKEGILETELLTRSKDVFSVIDRETGDNFAHDLGLNFAIYQGGIIKTSRPFCIERNNKVYSKDEIAKWSELDFEGKSTPYNPFTDCGGYNCRHQFDWISDELAAVLRPGLKRELNEG